MQPIADSFLVRPGHGSDVDALRMRFGCDPALDARRVTGAGRVSVAPHFNGLPPCLTSRLRASCAAALAILCDVSSRVAEPLQYEPSHTRLLAITEEFKFHPGLPGWNFSVPNAGWGMRVRNAQLGAPYEGNPLPGRTLLGVFAWALPVWGGPSSGYRPGQSGLLAMPPLGQKVLCSARLALSGFLGSAVFAPEQRARHERRTTKRN